MDVTFEAKVKDPIAARTYAKHTLCGRGDLHPQEPFGPLAPQASVSAFPPRPRSLLPLKSLYLYLTVGRYLKLGYFTLDEAQGPQLGELEGVGAFLESFEDFKICHVVLAARFELASSFDPVSETGGYTNSPTPASGLRDQIVSRVISLRIEGAALMRSLHRS